MTPEELGREIDKLAERERVYMPGREAQVMRWAALRVAGVEIQRLQDENQRLNYDIEASRHVIARVRDALGCPSNRAISRWAREVARRAGVQHTPQPAGEEKP